MEESRLEFMDVENESESRSESDGSKPSFSWADVTAESLESSCNSNGMVMGGLKVKSVGGCMEDLRSMVFDFEVLLL